MEFNGLPLHVLIIHFVVVLVPLSALLTVASAVWPFARRWLGPVTPAIALVNMVLVPVAQDAGQWLEDRVALTPLIKAHAALGNTLYPWVVALFIISVLQWVWYFFFARSKARWRVSSRAIRSAIFIVFAVAAIVVATGTIIDVVEIGEAGARAVYQNNFAPTPLPRPSGG
jgi:hypothetical protein